MRILIDEAGETLWVVALDSGRIEGLELDPKEENDIGWGAVYRAQVRRIDSARNVAFLDLGESGSAILSVEDVRKGGVKPKSGAKIGSFLRTGEIVPVQVKNTDSLHAQDPSEKAVRVSMDITLPGRYLIFAPSESGVHISRRIRDPALRKQISAMLESSPDIAGCIVRAAAQDTQTDVLRREGKILRDMWAQIQTHFTGSDPALLIEGPDAIARTLSDHAASAISAIEVVTQDQLARAEIWCDLFAPDLIPRLRPVPLKDPYAPLALFDAHGVMDQIRALIQPYAVLPGGGSLVIEQTAALTAIDVNSGGDRRGALAVNLEAAQEIARHVRVRNLGGIIIIDFLKMTTSKDRARILAACEEASQTDSCTVQIHGMTSLGLVELTRARRTPPLHTQILAG